MLSNRRQVDVRFFKRQVDVQRKNLSTICCLACKALLDRACLETSIEEDCEEFINFISVLEQVMSHRLRPVKGGIFGSGSPTPREAWTVLLAQQASNRSNRAFHSCIPSIQAIEALKSPRAKL